MSAADFAAMRGQAEFSGNLISMMDDTHRAIAGQAVYEMLTEGLECLRAHGAVTAEGIKQIQEAFLRESYLKVNTEDPERTKLTSI